MKTKMKHIMWHSVRELQSKGLKISQIARYLDIDRSTVRKYLSLDADGFEQLVKKQTRQPLKLKPYLSFIKGELLVCNDLSAAQIEDRLKEHFPDAPAFSPKTVFNFVMRIRKDFDIPKPVKGNLRVYEKQPDPPYGLQAQVDFGESHMKDRQGHYVKVYFFSMVLCRSRYKFVSFQTRPYTSGDAVQAHLDGFGYFGGVPKEIIYDQDSVFIHDENLGDYLLTHQFKAFCQGQPFVAVFCRKSDPESKGKVENVVKYVKYNFLRGRTYTGADDLNQQVLGWLARTGNGKKHAGTCKVPSADWEQEKPHLLPFKQTGKTNDKYDQYTVRKDNTLVYRGNYYSLPAGTYQGGGTQVLVEISGENMKIYTPEKVWLATHPVSVVKGEYVRNTDHRRNKATEIGQTYESLVGQFENREKIIRYLELLRSDKKRYFHDNLRQMYNTLKNESQKRTGLRPLLEQTLQLCLENKVYNAHQFAEILSKQILRQTKEPPDQQLGQTGAPSSAPTEKLQSLLADSAPAKSSITDYQNIFCNGSDQ